MKLYRLKNRTGFCITPVSGSADFGRLINTLRSEGICFYSLYIKKDRLFGYAGSRDYPVIEEYAEKMRMRAEITDKKGIEVMSWRIKRRIGFPVGFVLAVILISFLCDRTMIINISGLEKIPEERILTELADCGIYSGSSLSAVKMTDCERQMLIMDKGISWIGIQHTGSVVNVEVEEITDVPEMERKNMPCSIVASRDCQVIGIKVYSGMLEVLLGEGVKKGDMIVNGVVDTKYGRSYYVHSIAEIKGRYNEKMTFSQKLSSEETVITGEETRTALRIFGMELPTDFMPVPDSTYEYYEDDESLSVFGIDLPVKCVTKHYQLTEKQTVTRSEAEAEHMISERINRYERDILSDNGTVIADRKEKKTVTEECVSVTVEYTLEGEVGVEKKIFARYEPAGYSYERKNEAE